MKNIDDYVEKLTASVYERISTDICENKLGEIVSNVMKHTEGTLFKFHQYYIEPISKISLFTSPDNFFRKFKVRYALQGITNDYLDDLENSKADILRLIERNELSALYFKYFFQVKMPIEGNKIMVKSLGSFFAKLVHTLNPSQYCSLDNPVKDHFKLTNESFFISFIVISDAYRKWAKG